MALQHFYSREFLVKAGGRSIGPLHFGGQFYTVGPVSASTWLELCLVLERLLGLIFAERDFAVAGTALDACPVQLLRPVALLLVRERIADRTLRRLTKRQFAALWGAFLAANDWEYINSRLRGPESAEGNQGPPLGLHHMAMAVARATSGAYTPHGVLTEMPLQMFLAILEAEADVARTGDPDADLHITDADLVYFQRHYPEYFAEVN